MQRPHTHTLRKAAFGGALAMGLLAGAGSAHAQSAIIYGQVGNFDIANDTGKVCHGFEIDLAGVTAADINYGFSTERYGAPTITDYAGGAKVRWESPKDAQGNYVERTLQHTVSWFPGQCYQWSGPAIYNDSGCEHFGAGLVGNATSVQARWLCDDSANPGVLTPIDPPTAVPFSTYYVQPPVVANDPPQLVMEVQAPEPAEAPTLYGDAQWMRVYVRQLPAAVNVDQLLADNPAIVPMDPAQLETNWDIIQDEPVSGSKGNRRQKRNQGSIQPTTRAVVRRIEMYAFTGQYDPVTHEALCLDGLCATPDPSEVGELLSVQMTAANVQSDSVTVKLTGKGNVDSSDRTISCGSKCVASYNNGTPVTLTAKAASGYTFTGWTGACNGTQSTCTVSASGEVNVGATFTQNVATGGGGGGGGGSTGTSASLAVKVSGGKGLIVSTPAGINCGRTCAASVVPGTVVSLTATPDPGLRFVNWSGACTGTNPTCTVTVKGAMTAQANLAK